MKQVQNIVKEMTYECKEKYSNDYGTVTIPEENVLIEIKMR